jgi:DNA-binding transcriptional ArsR family regulator
MADHFSPDYPLEDTLRFEHPDQFKALFEETRLRIVDLLLERAATTKELAETLDKPKGTIGHHIGVLEGAGLIKLVRTKKVRAIEAKYYGRTARTYLLDDKGKSGFEMAPDHFLSTAADEFARSATKFEKNLSGPLSTLRYARIPEDRAVEWIDRLIALAEEFTTEPRSGEITYAMLLGFYPTERGHLPDQEQA